MSNPPPRSPRHHYLHGGAVIEAFDSFAPRFQRALSRIGLRATRHMRAGRFAVTVLSDDTLAIAEQYAGLLNDDSIVPGDQWWEGHVEDRTTQLDAIERRLTNHPLALDVREDIALERQHLRR